MIDFMFNTINSYNTGYEAILDAARTNSDPVPNAFVRKAANNLYAALESLNYLSLMDKLFVCAGDGASREYALLDWKNPGANPGLEVGTLTYDTRGFIGDGSTGYIRTQYNPAVDGVLFTQNDGTIGLHNPTYSGQGDLVAFGVRNAAGTAQVQAVLRSASAADNTRCVMNDNANSNFAGLQTTRGMFYFDRRTSANKGIDRRAVDSGNLASASVTLVNGEIYLLARNDLSGATVNLFSFGGIAMWFIGQELTPTQKIILSNRFIPYFLQCQNPLLISRSIQGRKIVFMAEGGADWDGGSIFGSAMYENGGTHFELYGGTTESGSGPTNYSVGAFDFTDPFTGTKDVNNPLIDLGDYPTLQGIFPMDCLIVGSTVYWFFTVRLAGDETHDTYIATSTTSDPKNIGTLTAMLTGGSTEHYNHGFKIIRDHPDTTYWYGVYSFRNTTGGSFNHNVARCLRANDLTNPANWSVLHTAIITPPTTPTEFISGALTSPVYNFCYYDGAEYVLLYGRFNPERATDGFAIFVTKSASLSSFPTGKEFLSPTGTTDTDPIINIDSGYTSNPYLDMARKLIYYSARRGGSGTSYVARCVKKYRTNYVLP